MHAIGGVDLEAFAGGIFHHFIDTCRAEAGAWVGVFFGALADADVGVEHMQVHRLVFVVRGGGVIDALQAITRNQRALHIVALWSFELAELVQ